MLTAGAACSLRYLICCSDRTHCTAPAATTAWAKRPRVARQMRPKAGQNLARSVTAILAATLRTGQRPQIYMERGTDRNAWCKYVEAS